VCRNLLLPSVVPFYYFCTIFPIQVYFGFSTLMFLFYLIEEQDFLLGNRAQPLGESLLEKGDVTVGEHTEGYTSTEGY